MDEYNVLTIDLDFAMSEDIASYETKINHEDIVQLPALQRWLYAHNFNMYKHEKAVLNGADLMYMFDVFTQVIKKCKNVEFGAEHDSILHYLDDKDGLHVVNIDHHHDILYTKDHKDKIDMWDKPDIGSWVYYLHTHGKLNRYTWIANENSQEFLHNDDPDRKAVIEKSCVYYANSPQGLAIPSLDYDYVYVCFSPDYIPPQYWFIFSMFVYQYEQTHGEAKFVEKDFRPFFNAREVKWKA